jgi:hypothetical protein
MPALKKQWTMWSSGLQCTDISEVCIASIFKVKGYAKQETDSRLNGFLLGLLFNPEDWGDMFLWMSADFYPNTWHYNLEDHNLQSP